MDGREKIGFPYDKIEEDGIVSPVIGIECDYKVSTKFNDIIEIEVRVKEFKGVKLIISYTMVNSKTNELVLTGVSKHCFINSENKPIILKKDFSELDTILRELANQK